MADGIQIDTEQVGEFAQGMRTEADKGFALAADRGADLHSHGVVFGAGIPGDTVLDAKKRYAEALAHTEANLRAYKQAAMALATAAEEIAKDFARADMSSEAAQRRVQEIMNHAIEEAATAMDGGQA
ncbi:hypothetical protein AB0J80_09305 [Actinoplanes sp. NPDC049548]|uniref:hypothetical protein n=1 Tax=Actinoplanes sp. NPDC049548 TaxID=3155152 RepID=UPI00342A4D87